MAKYSRKQKITNQAEPEYNAEAVVDACGDLIESCHECMSQITACTMGGPEHDAAMAACQAAMIACALTIADCGGDASDAECVAECIECALACDALELACDALGNSCPVCMLACVHCAEAAEECDAACDGNAGIVDDVEDEPGEEEPAMENRAVRNVTNYVPTRVIDGEMKPHEPFWKFTNSASGDTELIFEGPISEYSWWGDEITPKMFRDELYSKGMGGPVTMMINSPGGEVIAASVIRSILQEYPGNITADIVGLCASAATIMVTGADRVKMRDSALFMIHDPSSIAIGTIDEIKQVLDVLNTVKNTIVDVYQAKTGLEPAKLRKMMSAETWMTAKQACDMGFVDEVVTSSTKKYATGRSVPGFANCVHQYLHVPAALLQESQPVNDPAVELEQAAGRSRDAEAVRLSGYSKIFG